ncbi:disease resistance protein RML1A-like isoform X2 [Apium graveolens]|uniref:disease resistance protein RML1A-like isoform X2 n=1 Tax=Apium graveolens TaxID=4045 RepID=UPI003D79FFB2
MAASTSYNQIPSSTLPLSPTGTLWDVFLSFRGKDTRYTFTDHLYHALHRNGIRAFKDDPGLRSGDVISDMLIQAIQESKTYIVVLSENYASSSWCLDELVEILRCHKTINRLVVPVFYYIDPHAVRHQIKSFEEVFGKHQTRFGTEKVDKWRLTLNEVAGFSGYHTDENRSQAEIIDKVVDRILFETNPMTLDVAKYPIGLDSRVEEIKTLFNGVVESVIKIGIYGMGGVGKTTLAKAVYNLHHHHFPGSCFLENVREVSRTKGPVFLQQQLINNVLKRKDIHIDSVNQGNEFIRARICSRKVLIVIDDLDDPKPLEYLQGSFAEGSVIIITTRDEDLLDRIEVKAKYKVNHMDKKESLRLFTQHAFGEEKKMHTFPELSKMILKHAGGLPLALQVFGSILRNQPEDGWKSFIYKLKRAPIGDVEENLMISFDALKSVDPDLQDIFLDIACFFIGLDEKEVTKILETYYTFVSYKLHLLHKRCLITISDHGLRMHDLLEEIGRKIACNNYSDEPGKHTRLWKRENIEAVLKHYKGTEAIRAIGYQSLFKRTFDAKSFKKMNKLRFLFLNNVNVTGSFKKTFEDLRCLRWIGCPLKCLPSNFYPPKLVVLDLFYSKLKTLGHLNKVYTMLKTLDMSHSTDLITAPDFTLLPCLETLNLQGCSNLGRLPDSICSLRALEVLNVNDCRGLEALPAELGTIESLKELRAERLSVSKLPDSIGRLSNLVELSLGGNKNLEILADSICSLRALEVLSVGNCRKLEALPTELGSIESLKMLRAGSLSVSTLPDSIGCLSNLVELNLGYNTNLETLPDSICHLRSLEILDISDCEKLEELPDQLGMITCLRKLKLSNDTMLRVLPDISRLLNIEGLNLDYCSNLLSISGLPLNLESISAQWCKLLKRLPDLSSLKHLKKLDLTNCEALKEIQGLEEVTSLEDLRLVYCRSLEILPNLNNVKHLGLLYPSPTWMSEKIGGLKLTGCGNLLSISELPSNLGWIDAVLCKSLRRIQDLSNLKQLKWLDLSNCEVLTELPGLEEVTSLQDLCLCNCRSLERLPNLCNLKHLKRFTLDPCEALEEIIGLEGLTSLEYLYLSNCGSMARLPNLCNLKHLKMLNLTNCEALKEIQGLEEVTSLEDLRLDNCRSLKRLPNLCNLKHLKMLNLANCVALKEIQGLEEVTSLKDLHLDNCRSLNRLPNLCNLKHLKKLDLTNCSGLTEIQGLEELTSLRELHLAGCNSSLLTCTLRRRLYEILSGFGHLVEIYIGRGSLERYRCHLNLGIQLELGSHASHNFLAFIFAFEDFRSGFPCNYWVKNITREAVI